LDVQEWLWHAGRTETPKSVLHPCSTHQPTGEHLKCRSKSESALLNVDQVAVSETSNHPIVAQLLPKKSNKSNNKLDPTIPPINLDPKKNLSLEDNPQLTRMTHLGEMAGFQLGSDLRRKNMAQ